ncbi:MAG TPA: FUSC family protein [Gemmatimonadaceae bacterium]|nr:FUSC family protein [Gemmatimonadaceae bacterium]
MLSRPRWLRFRLTHDVRTAAELAHVRPAYAAGLRAAIATIAPLVLGASLPGGGGSWASLGGLNGAIGDRGGPYRTRAAVLGALAGASAIAALIGCLVTGHLALSVVVAFALAISCGLARAWNDVGPGFGVAILVTFAISLAVPAPTIGSALMRAGYIAAGGLWAMLLAIVLWPIRPYRPVRLRITECYRAVARYAEAAVEDFQAGRLPDPWAIKSHIIAVRTAIDSARTALAVARRGRGGETARGERLLILHELADQTYVHVIALLEEVEATIPPPAHAYLVLAATLADVAAAMRGIADAIESERDVPRVAIAFDGAGVRAASETIGDMVDRIAYYAGTAAELASSLNAGGTPPPTAEAVDVAEPPPEPVLFSIAAVMRPSSVVFHHAIRVAIVTAAAVLVTGLFHLNHGYWVTLTAVVILQPYAATTRQKALQRVIGTILGGVVAAALSAAFRGPVAVLVLIAIFTILCVALLPLNYGAYAVFGTPAFVLLAEASAGDWHLAGVRIINTLIGGALALAGAQLLWPGEEQNRLPELAAAALKANDELLCRALALVAAGVADLGTLRDVRRQVALAATNAEDSFQRLASEHRGSLDALEPIMTLLVYVRRIAASTAALVVASSANGHPNAAELGPFEAAAHDVLADLGDAARHSRAPRPFPPIGNFALPIAAQSPAVHQRLVRLARQLRLLHTAVSRWVTKSS